VDAHPVQARRRWRLRASDPSPVAGFASSRWGRNGSSMGGHPRHGIWLGVGATAGNPAVVEAPPDVSTSAWCAHESAAQSQAARRPGTGEPVAGAPGDAQGGRLAVESTGVTPEGYRAAVAAQRVQGTKARRADWVRTRVSVVPGHDPRPSRASVTAHSRGIGSGCRRTTWRTSSLPRSGRGHVRKISRATTTSALTGRSSRREQV
jgi:hypothetical protein